MRCFLVLVVLLLSVSPIAAQRGGEPPEQVRLWAGDAPGAQGDQPEDIPTLDIYAVAPNQATGAAVVVLPGGGYGHLAIDHEGE